jgi:hypothetical protein
MLAPGRSLPLVTQYSVSPLEESRPSDSVYQRPFLAVWSCSELVDT